MSRAVLPKLGLAMLAALLAAGCASRAPSPEKAPVKRADTGLDRMERLTLTANRCWFKSRDPAFANYSIAPELSSFSGRPRFLLVPKGRLEARPLLVVEGTAGSTDVATYGPQRRAERLSRRGRAGFALFVLASVALAGCRTDAAPLAAPPGTALNPAEVRYVRDTGTAIYRRQPFERTRGFVFADPFRGFAVCLRGQLRDGRPDHTLLILQRRIEGAISQVEDDATILRASADVGPCRNRSDWVPAR